MVSFAPLSAETYEDQRRYLEDHMSEVACLDCLATVRVRKLSEFQTSIQWTDEAVDACAEFTRARVEGRVGLPVGCARLHSSIARAVDEGRVEVGGGVD
jgi:hypothetical protein